MRRKRERKKKAASFIESKKDSLERRMAMNPKYLGWSSMSRNKNPLHLTYTLELSICSISPQSGRNFSTTSSYLLKTWKTRKLSISSFRRPSCSKLKTRQKPVWIKTYKRNILTQNEKKKNISRIIESAKCKGFLCLHLLLPYFSYLTCRRAQTTGWAASLIRDRTWWTKSRTTRSSWNTLRLQKKGSTWTWPTWTKKTEWTMRRDSDKNWKWESRPWIEGKLLTRSQTDPNVDIYHFYSQINQISTPNKLYFHTQINQISTPK